MEPQRIQIQNVQPQVDCGRFPVKACVGDTVTVSATIFRDGYDKLCAVVRYRPVGTRRWREERLEAQGNDHFEVGITPDAIGPWELRVQAWVDPYASWLDEHDRKVAAGQADLRGELSEGHELFGDGGVEDWRLVATALSDKKRPSAVKSALLRLDVDRELARFGAWYELFPRSWGGFRGVAAVLPEIAALGFDIVYLPPVHPIGVTYRKGRNNAEKALVGDPGSPWAIGGAAGGHDALHPDLGDDADFDVMVAAARHAGIELALDFAIQTSPDHPWLTEHPEWFNRRPDGTLKYAENPPKRYQDIHNVDWDTEQREALWNALKDVVLGWCARGILVFRVDNPHTKPVPFWEWLIAQVRAVHPGAIFLAEAFTRPAPMTTLAKLGFAQSYTYFTWKNSKHELVEFVEQVRSWSRFYRPNMWPNTPDILHEYLQEGGRPAFEARLVLATTISPSYGIYSGFEACENVPVRPGSEEYLDSEKYEVKERKLAGPLLPLIRRLNEIRRSHPALRRFESLTWLETHSDDLIAYAKRDGEDVVITVVNLNPESPQEGLCIVPPELGLPAAFTAVDLLSDNAFRWRTGRNYVGLGAGAAHVMALAQGSAMTGLGEIDLYLAGEGRHERLYERLGAHCVDGGGVRFAVWAPNARGVSVVGDWNYWSEGADPLTPVASSGIWEGIAENAREGQRYKLSVAGADGITRLKADPYAVFAEVPPENASIVFQSRFAWSDGEWLARRRTADPVTAPLSVYEVHAGSWRQGLSWRELAAQLVPYVAELGFTHVELMPVMQHPYAPSWGYQVSGYFAPQSTFGTPDDFRALVDAFHAAGIGVLLDWVPAHFPRDEWALARFDGTSLYEHDDPRRGAHPDWGTLIFNLSRHEVRNFLLANALYWVREFHADGLRVDAVASMLYLDYSRDPGEWVSNEQGGRENLEAVAFLRELNEVLHDREPGVAVIAEESTDWPGVSRPTSMGGLGFTFKWNMGWMHDTLSYVEHDPVHRRFHHDELTFSLVYAWDENFVLPLSHDEVVHGKRSLLSKMPGDRWQQLATLRALYGLMWGHPGKQLLFMGGELAEWGEWSEGRSLDWPLLDDPDHAGVRALVRDLNATYRQQPALWEIDFRPEGFSWLVGDARDENVIAFARFPSSGAPLVCAVNFAPVVREGWRLPLPAGGTWREVLNTDSRFYAGSDVGNGLGVTAEASPLHGQPFSTLVTLPPLATVWLVPE